MKRVDAWTLWLHNLGASVAYRLEADTAAAEGKGLAAATLGWEAARLARIADKHRARLNRPARKATAA